MIIINFSYIYENISRESKKLLREMTYEFLQFVVKHSLMKVAI